MGEEGLGRTESGESKWQGGGGCQGVQEGRGRGLPRRHPSKGLVYGRNGGREDSVGGGVRGRAGGG